MILKQLRIERQLSQELLAEMSGLSVRTIQRIESGSNASTESLKCIAAALDINIETLMQEEFVISKSSENWQALPAWLKGWFYFNLIFGPKTRATVTRLHWLCHGIGLPLLLVGWVSQPALAGGIILVLHAHLLAMLRWQGDKYAIWYDQPA